MKDTIVVITGASSGIGAALALELHQRGAKPILVARRQKELAEVSSRCGGARTIVADCTRRPEVERVVAEVLAKEGRLDVWVNNAGRGITRVPSELTDADLDEMMTVNVKSALYGMQTAVAHFQERGTGHVINVSSMLGRVPFATFRSAYCAAKHALNALTACLRVDVSRSHPGVHVSTVSPGVVATEFGVNAIGGGPDSRTMPGSQTAEEVAAVILDVIEHPRADAYTRPGAREMIAAYYAAEDMAELEKGWMAPPR